MKAIKKYAKEVMYYLAIERKIFSVAGATGTFSAAISSTRDGGIVPLTACTDPTPGSVNHHMQADRNCSLIFPLLHENDFHDTPATFIYRLYLYIRFSIFKALSREYTNSYYTVRNLMCEITQEKAKAESIIYKIFSNFKWLYIIKQPEKYGMRIAVSEITYLISVREAKLLTSELTP